MFLDNFFDIIVFFASSVSSNIVHLVGGADYNLLIPDNNIRISPPNLFDCFGDCYK